MYLDSTYLILLPAILLSAWAQMRVNSVYNRASKLYASCGLTAAQAARQMLDAAGLYDVPVVAIPGQNSSYAHNSKTRIIRLSNQYYNSPSITALSIAAHEVGHAIQHQSGDLSFNMSSTLTPVLHIGSNLSWPILFVGLLFGSYELAMVGVYLFCGVLAFHLVTLPKEFNASNRAIALLDGMGLLERDELTQARKVLNAAAMTYVAAAFSSLMQLLRLLTIANRSRRR